MSKPLRIAVVGAGIGGLAAAAFLRRAGHDVQVYEQATGFARVGAGIQMAPNAMKVLRDLGVEGRLRSIAFQPERALSREWNTGEITGELELGGEVERRFGAPYLFLHRGDLHSAIGSVVPRENVHLGMKLASLEQDPAQVTLAFADGTRVRADAVIGADGVHSLVRERLLGPERPRFTGRVAYRTTFPSGRVAGSRPASVRTKWWGPDRHMVIYYVTAARDELYFVTSVPEKAEWMTPESWSAKGGIEELRAAYAGFHPEVQAVLEACSELYKWAIFERDPLARWSDGRVVLLGDACHPMTPYMAQGAASALEDAAVLARCLVQSNGEDIEHAFRLYEAVRKPRASAIQTGSSQNNWLRRDTDPAWVYGYDATTAPLDTRLPLPHYPRFPTHTKRKPPMKISVLHDYADAFRTTRAYAKLKGHDVTVHTDAHTDPAKIVEQAAGAEALVLIQQRVPLARPVIEKLPQLKFISQTGGNVYHLDVPACTEQGIVISAPTHGGGGSKNPYSTTAELAWGLILASLRHIPFEVERLKQGHWQSTSGTRLYGRTLGVYAFGHIGGAVARVGRAFGMNVVCWGREGSVSRAKAEGFEVAASREAFFENADVISLHLIGGKETRGIVTAADLARMKPTALLVNTSRAPIIAEGALVTALKQGRPGFAAIDVFESEPVVGAAHPLIGMKNVICTPHLGYCEQEQYEGIFGGAVNRLLAWAEGKPVDVINPEALAVKKA